MNKIDLKKFNELKDQKLVSVQKHPVADLLIWNYTKSAQYAGVWTPELRMARGLITDSEGNIKYRPFEKFFNYEEHIGEDSKIEGLPNEPYKVFAKLDGSLGILYWIEDEAFIATRGSFESDQAVKGTIFLRKYDLTRLNKNYTYLFEIIYPENRIVVDYQGTQGIYLLAVIDTETGETLDINEHCDDFPFVGDMPWEGSIEMLKSHQKENQEGYVLLFESGKRVKIKFDEYVRLHRLITGVNAKHIWDLLRHGQKLDDLIERVPDEFYKWVESTKERLIAEYNMIEAISYEDYDQIKNLKTRKEQAVAIKKLDSNRKAKLSGIIFKILDKKPYEDAIWRMIKPKAELPFKEDIDA